MSGHLFEVDCWNGGVTHGSEVGGEVARLMGLLVCQLESGVGFDSFEVLEGDAHLAAASLLEVLDGTQTAVGPLGLGSFHWVCLVELRRQCCVRTTAEISDWVRPTAIAV